MKGMNYLAVAMLTVMSGNVYAAVDSGLTVLNDQELAAETGQALFNMSYLAPTDTGSNSGTNGNVGFYKLGMEAEVALNANIKKLQLGCGGANGAGACDIDIDYVSLSGLGNTATSNTTSNADRNARVGSDAILTNPFINLAIKNPGSASTREFVGMQLGAASIVGMMTFGKDNAKDASNNGIPNGINRLSGYMEISPQTGNATVNPITITQNGATNATGVALSGKACSGPYFGSCGVVQTTYTTNSYTLNLTPQGQTNLSLPQQVITGKRMISAPLTAFTTVNNIAVSGSLAADTGIGIPLSSNNVSGTLNNLKVNVKIDESLGLFHKASLNGSAASLSLQAEDIKWPGAKSVAARGWWLELSDPIDIGDITPNKNVDISMPTIIESLGQVNNQLANQWVYCGFFATTCLTGNIGIGSINLPTNSTPVLMELSNLSLKNQDFTPNCYGNLKFC